MGIEKLPGETDPEYIGDGVYASFDGFQIWLRTEREFMIHEIALEPTTLIELRRYAERIFSK